MNKYTALMLAILIVGAAFLYSGFVDSFLTVVGFSIPILAILAWYNNISKRRKEKFTTTNENVTQDTEDDGEYHNDFSKVPAGEADPFQPPPRSIGYGYGDGGRSVIEDLERIGIKTEDKKAEEKKNEE